MKKHTPAPEGYYEDDPDDVHDLALDEVTLRARLRQRLAAVMGTSYGISALVHVAILLVLATIIIASPAAQEPKLIQVSHAVEPPKVEEERERDLKDTPLVPLEEQVETPIIIQQDHVEVTSEVPRGISFDNPTDKNLEDRFTDDARGLSGGASGAYGSRFATGAPGPEGGGKETEEAVRAALEWLRRHQDPDGAWRSTWAERCQDDRCKGGVWQDGGGDHAVGYTGLAVLAFLGNGNTHRFAKVRAYRPVVQRALRFLRSKQRADGRIGWERPDEQAYDHMIATMALCEAYAITRDFELKTPAQRATEFLVEAQNPGLGWRYAPRGGRNDSSVTGWAVLALKAAHTAGFSIPPQAFDGARSWFLRATDSEANTGYQTPGGGSSFLGPNDGKFDEQPTNTGVALLSRLLMGERRSTDALRQATKHLLAAPPSWPSREQVRKVNFYYWYYGTYAMFQMGGQPWHDWNAQLKQALLPHQRRGGCADGSWDPDCPWALVGGRVYATAINALTFEIYYRYERARETPPHDGVERPR
ncbi:MAG: terpene cyclase/mutase family protein [Planctomycetes bacterium]|nr:terpene cyclase/mutase family protein [Planctomycetota bacterium]